MAIGDFATGVSAAGSIQVAITYTCPNCAFSNTTPTVSKPMVGGTIPQLYGAHVCVNCSKRMLISLSGESMNMSVQETS